jgi:hypothetical protein
VEDRHRAREIGEERDARLQRPDEERLALFVVGGELRAELGDAGRDLVRVEIDLADPGLERQLAFGSPKRAAMRSKSRS